MDDFLRLPSEFWAAIIGAIVGGLITIIGQWFNFLWTTRRDRNLREARKALLRSMLQNPGPNGWRSMEKLSGVIGTSREQAADLLIELGARRSTGANDVWALISEKPLPSDESGEE